MLTPDQIVLLEEHYRRWGAQSHDDTLHERYYDGEQRIEQLGIAVPPEFARFLLIVNWPGMYVDEVDARQDVHRLLLPGETKMDPLLTQIWDANNLDSELSLFNHDRYTYGRAFLSVGANEDNDELPLIRVESPREVTAIVDVRRRVITSAARFYDVDPEDQLVNRSPRKAVLYEPDRTTWVENYGGKWTFVDQDNHRLGRVPIVMSLCRRRSGSWVGHSLINRVSGITDAAARALTNLQVASEAHGVPQRYALGVSKGDFVDDKGDPLPVWQAYFGAIWANKNENIKVGQFDATDLKNFETQLNLYGKLAGSVTGMPLRYFGLQTTNPPSADAIRAEEAQFVKFVQRQNAQVGATLGWAAALSLRFAGRETVDGSRIGVEWIDPSTPTIAQREDALMKRYSQGVMSREGYWDELGWSTQRMDIERQRLAKEAAEGFVNVKIDAASGA